VSEKLKSNVAIVSAFVGILAGVFGFIQAYAVLPYRVEQIEKDTRAMKDERKTDREILIRIEEQVRALREEIRRNP
jgi:predicted cobalt transporter CbtA